jgi:hypothetical protein
VRFHDDGYGAGELQVGYVDTRDEQHRDDTGEKDQKRLAIVSGYVALQRLKAYLAIGEK